jgi:hypothetical protein
VATINDIPITAIRVHGCLQRKAQQAMNVSVLFVLNTIDIDPITNILYLQQSWFPEQAQQQQFVFPQFQSSMPRWGLHAPPPPPAPQVLQFS